MKFSENFENEVYYKILDELFNVLKWRENGYTLDEIVVIIVFKCVRGGSFFKHLYRST